MKIFSSIRKKGDALVVPFWKDEKERPYLLEGFAKPVSLIDFEGNVGDTLVLYPDKELEKRFILLGLGDKKSITTEKLRRAYGALAKMAAKKKILKLNILKPSHPDNLEQGIVEGLLLPEAKLEEIRLIGKWDEKLLKELIIIFEEIYFARELINGNPDEVTPEFLAQTALKAGKDKLSVTLLNKKGLEKEKMGLILAVSRASSLEPYLIRIDYQGDPKSKERTVLIGKGVTYDTGGLNLKQSLMEEMKADMAGGATVLAVMKIISKLKLKINVSALIPTVENAIGPLSYKLGNVYTSHAGKKVEVTNTDAEGRLILADAISYAKKYLHPTYIIDIATLTGAIIIALGNEGIGLFSNHDMLAETIMKAGSETYERAFRLPLIEEYKDILKSEQGDIKNWNGRMAGSIVASIFLQEFAQDTPWAHLDFASCAFLPEGKRYYPKFATGIGVRLLLETLKSLK